LQEAVERRYVRHMDIVLIEMAYGRRETYTQSELW